MRLQHINILFLCVGLFLFCSCGNFEKIRKSSDVNFKMTKANEYYDKQDYQHANELYKELMPIMKSTRNYEALCYKYSYTFYYLKDYIQASFWRNWIETNRKNTELEFWTSEFHGHECDSWQWNSKKGTGNSRRGRSQYSDVRSAGYRQDNARA